MWSVRSMWLRLGVALVGAGAAFWLLWWLIDGRPELRVNDPDDLTAGVTVVELAEADGDVQAALRSVIDGGGVSPPSWEPQLVDDRLLVPFMSNPCPRVELTVKAQSEGIAVALEDRPAACDDIGYIWVAVIELGEESAPDDPVDVIVDVQRGETRYAVDSGGPGEVADGEVLPLPEPGQVLDAYLDDGTSVWVTRSRDGAVHVLDARAEDTMHVWARHAYTCDEPRLGSPWGSYFSADGTAVFGPAIYGLGRFEIVEVGADSVRIDPSVESTAAPRDHSRATQEALGIACWGNVTVFPHDAWVEGFEDWHAEWYGDDPRAPVLGPG